jgi:hypothetical protein
MGPTRSSSVSEMLASTFTSSVNSKNSQKDKQSNGNNNNNSSKKKENTISYNIISILRLWIYYSIIWGHYILKWKYYNSFFFKYSFNLQM